MADDPSAEDFDRTYWVWGAADDQPRFLHTMIRVRDFEVSLRFYVEGLGMKVLDRFEVPAKRTSALFVGFGGYSGGGLLELTCRWDDDEPLGLGPGHVAIGVPDIRATMARLEAIGAEVVLQPVKYFDESPLQAFVKDPDGCTVELIQTRRT